MFRIRIRNERLWRRVRDMPIAGKLLRIDMLGIPAMRDADTIDLAFSDIDLSSGVSKQTNIDRFAEVDERIVRILVERSLSRVLDVGVSSGITSLELAQKLRMAGIERTMCISDKFARFWIVRRGLSTDVFDSERNLVYAYLGPIAGDRDDSWKVALSRFVYRRAERRGFCDARKEPFLLLHPDVLAAIERGELEFVEFDVFDDEQAREFDFVRCMNLLNLGYFAPDRIAAGLGVLHASIAAGGVLQLGRTHADGSNHVSFYEKAGDGFRPLESIGSGSEIDDLVQAFNPRE